MKRFAVTFVMFMAMAGGQQKPPSPQECGFKEAWIISKTCVIIVDQCGHQKAKGICPT